MSDDIIDVTEIESAEINTVVIKDQSYITKQQTLLLREKKIDNIGGAAYLHIGLELAAIHEEEAYKLPRAEPIAGKYTFTTFEEYAEARWGYKSTYTYDIMRAAKAVLAMANLAGDADSGLCGEIKNAERFPRLEAHVKPLLKLELPQDQLDVWEHTKQEYPLITGPIVETEVKRFTRNKNRDYQTIEEWKEDPWPIDLTGTGTFNEQQGNSIEWARWSFNPVTGCLHDCSYCYARDIQNRLYPEKNFAPTRHPARYSMPKNTKVPELAKLDISYKNVFLGSMTDLFGRWIPKEWIEEAIECVIENPQFNFLTLTKFPNRYKEFTYPKNMWLGTSVDCQARVKNAEKAFEHVEGTTWLSVEPMLTPLKFEHLDRFDWVVIGGASSSNNTPAWVPPMDWIMDLYQQARAAGCKIYFKDNLPITGDLRIKEFPWVDPPIKVLPDSFKYMKSIK